MSNYDVVITPRTVRQGMARRMKSLRKLMGYTQHELAQRSGVSYASVKRFEQTGDISLVHLLKLANVLNRLIEFDTLFKNDDLAEAMQVIAKRAKA